MISYNYNTNNKIIYVTLSGEVSLKNIFDHLEKLFTDDQLPKKIKILYDLQKAVLNLSSRDIDSLNDFSARTSKHFESVTSAFLTSQLNQTELSLIFTINNPYENINRDVFTTKDVAMEWLEDN